MDEQDLNEIIQLLQQQQQPGMEEMIQQLLLQLLMNPVSAKTQKISLNENPEYTSFYEVREGTILDQHGNPMEMEELVINPRVLADGTPMNLYGIVRCPYCQSLIKDASLRVCPCGEIVCTVRGCGVFSRWKQTWYCSRKHRLLHLFGFSLR